jgi:mannitol-specific phosphotransferase system IIBC component
MRKSSTPNIFIVAIVTGLLFGIAMKMTTSVINKKGKEGFAGSTNDIGIIFGGLIVALVVLVGAGMFILKK